jgi:hypothetical protein
MRSFKPWLLLVLVFLTGVVGGVVATRVVLRHVMTRAVHDPDYLQARIERSLTSRLRLDQAQSVKVHLVLSQARSDLKDLRQEFQPKFLQIIAQSELQIRDTLTPQQRERFDKMQKENRDWWRPK